MANAIVRLPSFGTPVQTIELKANYGNSRLFVKHVTVTNACRLGDDTLAKGAIDLIGRVMAWEIDSINGLGVGTLTNIALRFPYDYDINSLSPSRTIGIPPGVNKLIITGSEVGL